MFAVHHQQKDQPTSLARIQLQECSSHCQLYVFHTAPHPHFRMLVATCLLVEMIGPTERMDDQDWVGIRTDTSFDNAGM